MTNYLPLRIPYGSKWENLIISRNSIERPDNSFPSLVTLEPVPARQGGITLSADLLTPTAGDAQALLHKAAWLMTTRNQCCAFLFESHLFALTGWAYNPETPDIFQVTATSLASLEDIISLLPC